MSKTWGILLLMLVTAACSLRREPALKERASAARTPAEHAAVAAAYHELSQRLQRESVKQALWAKEWAGIAGGVLVVVQSGPYVAAQQYDRRADTLAAAAAQAEALARTQDRLAEGGPCDRKVQNDLRGNPCSPIVGEHGTDDSERKRDLGRQRLRSTKGTHP